jgi:hypothetical protein
MPQSLIESPLVLEAATMRNAVAAALTAALQSGQPPGAQQLNAYCWSTAQPDVAAAS